VNSHERIGIKPGVSVVILGGGPLGAIHAELAKAEEARKICLGETCQQRLDLLKKIKGIELFDPSKTDISETLGQFTNGLGFDVVIVCAPATPAMEESLKYARKGGIICYFASVPKGDSTIRIDSRMVHYGELSIIGSSDSRPEHVQKAIDLISTGKIDCDAIITHRIMLGNIVEGFELMKKRVSMKVLVYPEGNKV
jgi:L-iditol 2-dehydrogenase